MENRIPSLRPRQPDYYWGIGLGKNWDLLNYGAPEMELSLESQITAIAIALLHRDGVIKKILFSTGETAGKDKNGKNYPTEARAMYLFMRRYFGLDIIPENDICFEESSYDTAGNAEKVGEIIRQRPTVERAALLTVGYHLPRSIKLFSNFGVNVDGFSSEKVLEHKRHHNDLLRRYSYSPKRAVEYGKELVGRALVHTIDPHGNFLRKITTRTRNRQN